MTHPCIVCGGPVESSSPDTAVCDCLENLITSYTVKLPDDKKMFRPSCPLCQSKMRPIVFLSHVFGDHGRYQCDECAAIVEVNNNLMRKRYELRPSNSKGVDYSFVLSLSDEFVTSGDWAPLNTHQDKKREAEKRAIEEDQRREKCEECEEQFLPHIRARCDASKKYCSKCRKKIPSDDPRWKYDDNGPK